MGRNRNLIRYQIGVDMIGQPVCVIHDICQPTPENIKSAMFNQSMKGIAKSLRRVKQVKK